MDLSAFEWLVVSVFGVFAVVGLAVVVLLDGASPIDLLPEAFLGPLGVVDDVGIVGAALAFFISQVRKGQAAQRDDPVTIQRLPD
jgi:uncharacterized membrane protein YkvA (DUF1232 family)